MIATKQLNNEMKTSWLQGAGQIGKPMLFGDDAPAASGLSLDILTDSALGRFHTYVIRPLGTGLSAYHGFKRHHGSIAWAVGWGILGSIFPIITPVIGYAQGYAQPA